MGDQTKKKEIKDSSCTHLAIKTELDGLPSPVNSLSE